MKYVLQFAFLFLFFLGANAQDMDSLKKVISSKKNDTLKILALSDINWIYSTTNPDESKPYLEKQLKIAKKTKNNKWISLAYNDQAIYWYRKGNYDSAIYYNEKALKLRLKLKDENLIASSYSKIGLIHSERGNFTEALLCQLKVLDSYEKLDLRFNKAITLNNISIIYEKLKNFKKSMDYAKRALALLDPEKEDYYVGQCYGNLGGAYYALKKYEKSLEYFEKALVIFKKYGDKSFEAGAENGLGMNMRSLKRNQEAYEHYKRAYDLSVEIKDQNSINLYATNLSIVLRTLGKYKEAEKYLLEALKNTDPKNEAQLLYTYRQLATIYGFLNKGTEVEYYLDKFADLKEKTFSAKSASEIANFETRYHTEITKRRLSENQRKLENRQFWLTTSLILIFFLIVVAFLVYRSQKNKRKQVELNKELEKTRLEKDFADEKIRIARELHDNIGSHLTFMISSLDNLAYIENPEKKLEKVGDLSNFGRLTMKDLRDTIWAMNHDGGSFEQLIARISELRSVLPSTLFVDIKSEVPNQQALNGLQLLNCYRIVQEFIQNTIKYANASEVKILFKEDSNFFTIEIGDNGSGFDLSTIHFGNGILNMKRRCEDLGGSFAIKSDSKGTYVTCTIPYNKN